MKQALDDNPPAFAPGPPSGEGDEKLTNSILEGMAEARIKIANQDSAASTIPEVLSTVGKLTTHIILKIMELYL